MAQYAKLSKPYDQIVCQDYALPANATPVILTNTCTIDAATSGKVVLRVYAGSTTTEIANPYTLAIHAQVGTTAAATQTFNTTGTVLPGIFWSAVTASTCTDYSWAPGELMGEYWLPMEMIKSLNASNTAGTAAPSDNIYVSFWVVNGAYNTTAANESADNIEAYLFIEA